MGHKKEMKKFFKKFGYYPGGNVGYGYAPTGYQSQYPPQPYAGVGGYNGYPGYQPGYHTGYHGHKYYKHGKWTSSSSSSS
ncbi:unnamed protein product [Brachionus calyciflorus]|uniref:Uncharacterized protein n=1 Tax=Brachionus calyciflorus TaxID=104777 RepID=A0A813VZZ5_9BILA|nr:unnamed protein product [Brachionus calyciflorus]